MNTNYDKTSFNSSPQFDLTPVIQNSTQTASPVKVKSKNVFENISHVFQSTKSKETNEILAKLSDHTKSTKKKCKELKQKIKGEDILKVRPYIIAYIQVGGSLSSILKELGKQYNPKIDSEKNQDALDRIGLILQEENKFIFGSEEGKASRIKKFKFIVARFFGYNIENRIRSFVLSAFKAHGLHFDSNDQMWEIESSPLRYLVNLSIHNSSQELYKAAIERGWEDRKTKVLIENENDLWRAVKIGAFNKEYEEKTGQPATSDLKDQIKQYLWMNYARSTDRKGYFIHLLNLSSQAPKQWMEAFEQLKDDLQVEPWIKEVGSFSDLQEKLIERHQIDGQFFIFNESHFSNEVKESSLPALKQEVDLFRLERMFNEINFVDPQKVNYRTPSTLNDEGRPINPSILKNSLSNLLDNIKNNSRIAFAPSSDTERKKWYGNIALYLKHILLLLEKLPVENRTEYLIDLALVGSHCGGRYIGECLLTYQLLSGQMMDFSQQILSQLSSMRSGIAASIAPNKSDDFQVHAINAVIAKIGEAKGLPGYDFALQDKGIKYVQVRPADLTFQFDQHYSPATVLERVADEINNHSIGSTGQSSYERALDWFKDHIPEDWTPKNRNYSELFKQLEELSQRDASRQEISEFLLENDIGGSVITPEESRIAKELRILKDQYQELERIESHLKEETEDTNLYRELWKEKLVEFQMSDQLSQKREVILEGLKTKIENTLLSYGQLKQKTSSQEIVKLAKSLIENERKKAFLEEIVENPLDKTKKIKKSAILYMLEKMKILDKS